MSSPTAQVSQVDAVAVYCASSIGKEKAFQHAALSVGQAIAEANRPLVCGGTASGLMRVVSGVALAHGGRVIAVEPWAMHSAGGEREKGRGGCPYEVVEQAMTAHRDRVETIIVNSMHERKFEMAKRSCGFIALPGGFGTLDELLEMTTWTQIGIHSKPVVVLNVLSYFSPLRDLIRRAIAEGFINENFIVFVDGPSDDSSAAHENFPWGKAALEALENWWPRKIEAPPYDWTQTVDGSSQPGLDSS